MSRGVRGNADADGNSGGGDQILELTKTVRELKDVVESIPQLLQSLKEELRNANMNNNVSDLGTGLSGEVRSSGFSSSSPAGSGRQTKYSHKRKLAKEGHQSKSSPSKIRQKWETTCSIKQSLSLVKFQKTPIETQTVGPFTLERKVDDGDEKLLKYMFDDTLLLTEIIVQFDLNALTREKMMCLKPNLWIDGEVICAVGEMLLHDAKLVNPGKPRSWYFPSRFAQVELQRKSVFISFVYEHGWGDIHI